MGAVPNRHLAARSATVPATVPTAVNAVALLLTGPHSFPLCRGDDGVDFLAFPLMNLLGLLPLLLYGER